MAGLLGSSTRIEVLGGILFVVGPVVDMERLLLIFVLCVWKGDGMDMM